jgi:outer membrane lipoprotein SlyB
MRGNGFHRSLLPLLLAAGLGACASGGVQPGIVSRSGPPTSYSQNQGYGQNPTYGQNPSYVQNAAANGPVAGTTPLDPNDPSNAPGPGRPPQPAVGAPGDSGRVVSINEVGLRGSGGGGVGNGTMIGGLLGGLGGATIGAATGHTVGSGIVGGLLGVVGGAIAGSIFEGNHGGAAGGRGIEVTVQKDDGSKVTVAQRDDGDVQLGDRVQIVQGRNGVPQVVRDTSRHSD